MAKAQHASRYRRLPAFLRRLREAAGLTQRGLASRLRETHGIDPGRVYAIGYSNGGQMVMRLLHEDASPLAGGAVLLATIHPSFLLRLPDRAEAEAEYRRFVADLAAAR